MKALPIEQRANMSDHELELIADHHNHLVPVIACLSCHEKTEVHCPTCGNKVLPCNMIEVEVYTYAWYGVGVRGMTRKCSQCNKAKRKKSVNRAV